MTISLQRFATGDTSYIGKHNANADALEAAFATLEAILTGITGGGVLSLSAAFEALFGATVAVIGKDSYACSGASTTLTVQAGYCWRPLLQQVLSKAGSTTISFSGLAAATYYVQVDATGTPIRTTDSTEAVYSVVWTGSAFGTITRLANIAWGEADWLSAQVSAALAASYTSLDARLEAGEALAVANQLPVVDTTALIKGSSDSTKQVKFEVDGLTTATTRTVTVPNKNGTMAMLDDISGVLGALIYQGTWNATTNSPAIPAAISGNKGYYYKVATAGTTSIDGIAEWAIGDWIVSNGTTWDKIDNTEAVSSVAGRTGAIVLAAADLPAQPVIVSITWASTITIDFTGHPNNTLFRCTLAGNTTVNITGGSDGQQGMIELAQDATGSRIVTLSTDFAFGTDIASFTATTTASKTDILGVKYNGSASKYRVIAAAKGY